MQKLLVEHSAPGSRDQLKELWTAWLDRQHVVEQVGASDGRLTAHSTTPHDSDTEEAGPAAATAGSVTGQ